MADMPLNTLYCEIDFDISTLIADSDGNGKPDRVPLSGSVTFAPSIGATAFVHKPTGAVIYADVENISVGADGKGKVILVATDSPDLYAQSGKIWKPAAWNYTVTVTPTTSGGIRRAPIVLTISAPGGTASTLGQLLLGQLPTTGTTTSTGTTTPSALTLVPSGDNSTFALSGTNVVDNGNGTWSASGTNITDNGDGTYSIAA